MKINILGLALLLTPFFSQANIWVNADTKPPETVILYSCKSVYAGDLGTFETLGACGNALASAAASFGKEDASYTESVVKNSSSWYLNGTYEACVYNCGGDPQYETKDLSLGESYQLPPTKQCPNQNYLDYTYSIYLDEDSEPDSCANPDNIPLIDSCNINDSPNLQVTEQSACYTKSDGSQCSISAVDVGGGNMVYMGDEGNCYADPKPDVTGNDTLGQTPTTNQCVNNGGLLACLEDPANVCVQSGSNYGGGSVNNCQSGCGYVNDSFMCYDTDIDSDGLPDYNDPDKDGDGIPNDSDLDSDGDGKDDPINTGDGNQQGSGGGSVTVDLTPVVSKLDEIKKSMSETNVEIKKEPTPDLVGFWESEYEDGLAGVMEEKMAEVKTTQFFTFIDQFNPSLSGGSAASYDMCFNLGRMGNFGCHNFNVDPRVIPAIRIFILVSAVFLCRKILFGG